MEFGYSPPTTPIVPCPAGFLAMLLKLPQLLRLLLDPGIEALGNLPWSIERNVVSSTAKTLLCFFKVSIDPLGKPHISLNISLFAPCTTKSSSKENLLPKAPLRLASWNFITCPSSAGRSMTGGGDREREASRPVLGCFKVMTIGFAISGQNASVQAQAPCKVGAFLNYSSTISCKFGKILKMKHGKTQTTVILDILTKGKIVIQNIYSIYMYTYGSGSNFQDICFHSSI